MDYDKSKTYGTQVPEQPGGRSPQPPPNRTQATAPCRVGPARTDGGAKRANLNPYSGKK